MAGNQSGAPYAASYAPTYVRTKSIYQCPRPTPTRMVRFIEQFIVMNIYLETEQ
jgi:hypothetical protein